MIFPGEIGYEPLIFSLPVSHFGEKEINPTFAIRRKTPYACLPINYNMVVNKLKCGVVFLVLLILWSPATAISEEWIIETSPTDFYPYIIQAHVGDKVTWINSDAVVHEIDFAGNPTKSNQERLHLFIRGGTTVAIILSKPGTYHYKCSWHGMHGNIEISPANSSVE